MTSFKGKYILIKSENFEEYLKARGAGFMAIKMATALTPYLEINNEVDIWTLKVYTFIKTVIDMKFKLDEEFYHTRMDGTKCKVVIHIDGNKLIEEETPCNKPEDKQKNIREWTDDNHILTCKDVVAKRYFERIE
ncbi:unnamed protein product [Gordionus sp. m RMFG-2023]